MKRIVFLLTLLSLVTVTYGQAEMDAIRLSQKDLQGTARYVGMGGAFNALGGDATAISNNPAGLGIFRSSELSFTTNLSINNTDMKSVSTSTDNTKWHFNVNSFAFVGAFKNYKNTALKYSNFAVTYNRLKNYRRNMDYVSYNANNSMLNYLAAGGAPTLLDMAIDELYVIDELAPGVYRPFSDLYRNNDMYMYQKGSLDEWGLSYGGNINDVFYFGVELGIRSLDYHIHTDYIETYYNGNQEIDGDFNVVNDWRTSATGFNLKLGTIFRPLDFMRIGVSFQTPTWYHGKDDYSMYGNSSRYYPIGNVTEYYEDEGKWYGKWYDYDMSTPFILNTGLSFIIGQKGILSADYERQDYSKIKYSGNDFTSQNNATKADMKVSHIVRVGGEYRVTDAFSVRAGYSLTTSPVKSALENRSPVILDIMPHYFVPKTNSNYSVGIGFKGNRFFFDAAYVLNMRKDHFYAYATADKVTAKSNTHNIITTFGWRF